MTQFLEKITFNLKWRPVKTSVQARIRKYSKSKDDIFFIQIGSNDGVTRDPLYRHIIEDQWQGIVVEPVRYIYEKLVRNYSSHHRVTCENLAIGDENGFRNFYRLRENDDGLPVWYDQIGSFDLGVVLAHRHKIEGFDRYLMTDQVRCVTLDTLLNDKKVRKLDLLHIDSEGYDYEIIKMLDMSKFKPEVILFEHKHLSIPVYTEAIAHLKRKHYRLYREKNDTLAILR
ncbi:MAG: FkbM family methyltransferase [Balneolales bacterium]